MVLPGLTALPGCLFPTPHSQPFPACPVCRWLVPWDNAGSGSQNTNLRLFLWWLCIPLLPAMEPGSGRRFPPTPRTFLALEQHELSGFPAPRFQLGSGIELSHANFHLALTNEEAVPEPRADPAARARMKSPGFHLCSCRKLGCLCPCAGPRRALGGRKDRQSCTFSPSRHKLIKTCCITAPLTFTRVTSAKSWHQISLPEGNSTCPPNEGSFLLIPWEPECHRARPNHREHSKHQGLQRGLGEECTPCQRRAADLVSHKGKQCFASANPPPFLRQGHQG